MAVQTGVSGDWGRAHTNKDLVPTSIFWTIAVCVLALLAGCATAPAPEETPTRLQSELQAIDSVINQTIAANIAYNVPASMQMDDTAAIQLLLSPALSAPELKQQITESGIVTTGSLNITPRMKAELKAADRDAFVVRSVHADAEQVISSKEATEWEWLLQAKKEGVQPLTLTLYRLVEYDGKEYWRQKSYENTIEVTVTLSRRLQQFDWKWLFGIILPALLIPAIWRWIDSRQKQKPGSKKRKAA